MSMRRTMEPSRTIRDRLSKESSEIHEFDKGSTYDNVISHNVRGCEIVRHASAEPGVGASSIDQQGVYKYIRKLRSPLR